MASSLGVLSGVENRRVDALVQNAFAKQDKLHTSEREFNQLETQQAQLLEKKRSLINQMADLTIAQSRALKEQGRAIQAESCHNMATNALTMVFYSMFLPPPEILAKASESDKINFDKTAMSKCKLVVESYLRSAEQAKPSLEYTFVDEKECLRLTPPVAAVIANIFEKMPCVSLNFENFKDEIDANSIKKLLSDNRVKQVKFHEFVKASNELRSIVMGLKKTHHDFAIVMIKA